MPVSMVCLRSVRRLSVLRLAALNYAAKADHSCCKESTAARSALRVSTTEVSRGLIGRHFSICAMFASRQEAVRQAFQFSARIYPSIATFVALFGLWLWM